MALRVAELAQERAGFGLDVGDLFLGEVTAPATDGLGVDFAERFRERGLVRNDVRRDARRGGVRVGGELLVAHFERGCLRGGSRCGEVAAPGPTGTGRLARG